MQLPAYVPGEHIFSDYAYFSSYSDSWVAHAKRYADEMTARLGLATGSLVTEVASNDGYLLQHFAAAGIPVLGVEPAGNVAKAAMPRASGPWCEFLGPDTGAAIAAEYGQADLVAANNVFAHVPDIRGFAAGLRALVKDSGSVTLEFPHLLRLIERRQYDTIYHEHFSYLSLLTSGRALEPAGLRVVDVEELSTHGGSLRVHARPAEAAGRTVGASEGGTRRGRGGWPAHGRRARGLRRAMCCKIKSDLLDLPHSTHRPRARRWRATARPGKGNTLLNHCGIRSDLLTYTVDRSPVKQGKFLPGTHIPIYAPEPTRRDEARLHPRAAVEPAGGDQRRSCPTCGPGAGGWSSRFPALEVV